MVLSPGQNLTGHIVGSDHAGAFAEELVVVGWTVRLVQRQTCARRLERLAQCFVSVGSSSARF